MRPILSTPPRTASLRAGLTPLLSDPDIRSALLARLRAEHDGDAATVFVEELGLCDGSTRADVVVVNGALSGYEIKSDRDTLDRLPRQRRLYDRVFDTITVVTAPRHLPAVRRRVPPWWGIVRAAPRPAAPSDALRGAHPALPGPRRAGRRPSVVATPGRPEVEGGGLARCAPPTAALIAVQFDVVRVPTVNPARDREALVQFLWRDEALAVLRTRGLARGLARAPKRQLWARVLELFSAPDALPDLQRLVRDTLRARAGVARAGTPLP